MMTGSLVWLYRCTVFPLHTHTPLPFLPITSNTVLYLLTGIVSPLLSNLTYSLTHTLTLTHTHTHNTHLPFILSQTHRHTSLPLFVQYVCVFIFSHSHTLLGHILCVYISVILSHSQFSFSSPFAGILTLCGLVGHTLLLSTTDKYKTYMCITH